MRKALIYSFFPILGAGILSAGVASAQGFSPGGYQTPADIAAQFQNEATLLGVGVDEIKAAWAQGKTLFDVAQAHNITKEQIAQKMKDQRTQTLKTQLQALVTQGVITQAQADQRLAFAQANPPKAKGPKTDAVKGKGRGMGIGFGRGGRFGHGDR